MEDEELDYLLVPLGLLVMTAYHIWLTFTIFRHPQRTVIGVNAECRRQWVLCVMTDPLKNGTLSVQTIRNNIQASTLLATTALTLSSLISVLLSSKPNSLKYFSIVLCFLVAFLCNVQSIRYYAHVSFLVTLPTRKHRQCSIEYVTETLNRGGFFWSLGLRAFYFSFPLFLWIFGSIPMFSCCVLMSFILYFLDTNSSFRQDVDDRNVVESTNQYSENARSEDDHLRHPLLTSSSSLTNSSSTKFQTIG